MYLIADLSEYTVRFIPFRSPSFLLGLLSFSLGESTARIISALPRIEHEWSGVLGLGATRMPKVQRLESGIVLAAGLGGMGVALGSLLGKEAAQMIL